MNIFFSYDPQFEELMDLLKSKYPQKLFDMDGIGKQLDLPKFSKDFFAAKTTADVSIDANSNLGDMSIIVYNAELPKPFLKLNSYYMLWKHLKKLYGKETADEVIEMQVCGDIYVNDVHGIGSSQAYCSSGSR